MYAVLLVFLGQLIQRLNLFYTKSAPFRWVIRSHMSTLSKSQCLSCFLERLSSDWQSHQFHESFGISAHS